MAFYNIKAAYFRRFLTNTVAYILCLCLFLFALSTGRLNAETKPYVNEGVLDLSSWDLKNQGNVELRGDWQFYWKQLLDLNELNTISDKEKRFLEVPATWNNYKTGPQEKDIAGGQGYGTYFLKIIGLNPLVSSSLYFSGFLSAYKVTAISFDENKNEIAREIIEIGKVARSRKDHIAFDRGTFVDIGKGGSSAFVIVHASNFNHRVGGLERKVFIGSPGNLSLMLTQKNQLSFILIGVLLIMAIYHFGLFSLRREDKASLWFGIFCLNMFVRQITAGGYFETLFDQGSNTIFAIRYKLEYLSLYFAAAIACKFVSNAFPGRIQPWFIKACFTVSTLFSIPVILFDPLVFSNYILYFHPFNGVACIYGSVILIYATIKKDEGAAASLFGLIVLVLTIANDVMHSTGIIKSSYLAPYGFMAFILAQSYILSLKFASAHKRSEYLGANLKKEVDRQTSELREKSQKLEEQNDVINSQFDKIKTDLQIAANVMDAMLPDLKFENDFCSLKFFFKPADELAGDLYGMEKRGNRLMFWLCDVTGHGVASSMVAGVIREAMAGCRIETLFDETKEPDPAKALKIVSGVVGKSIKGKFFATMTLQVIDFNTRKITFSNAAHLKPIHFREEIWQKKTVGKIQNGPLIGFVGESIYGYQNFTFQLEKNDFLFVFTDGLNEASFDSESEEFGKKRIVRFLKKNINNEQLLNDLFDEVIKFQNKKQLDDDITMAVIKVN